MANLSWKFWWSLLILPYPSFPCFLEFLFLSSRWEPAHPLQTSPGPSGNADKVSKMSPEAPGLPKVYKKSRDTPKTLETLSKDSPETSQTVTETLLRLFGARGRHFRDFFGISGPEGLRDLCKGRAGSQSSRRCSLLL